MACGPRCKERAGSRQGAGLALWLLAKPQGRLAEGFAGQQAASRGTGSR